MQRVGEVLPIALQRLGVERQVRMRVVVAKWPEVVGEVLARVSKASFLRAGILWVDVADSAWQHELMLRREELCERIARLVGEGVVRDIRFRTGQVVPRAVQKAVESQPAWHGYRPSALKREWHEVALALRQRVSDRQRELEHRRAPTCSKCERRFDGVGTLCPVCRVG